MTDFGRRAARQHRRLHSRRAGEATGLNGARPPRIARSSDDSASSASEGGGAFGEREHPSARRVSRLQNDFCSDGEGPMDQDTLISVRRHPSDWQTARFRLRDIRGFRWDGTSGGVGRAASHTALFGYVWCNAARDGEVAHSCSHGPGPHEIKVCVPKVCNKENWKALLEIAPPKPGKR